MRHGERSAREAGVQTRWRPRRPHRPPAFPSLFLGAWTLSSFQCAEAELLEVSRELGRGDDLMKRKKIREPFDSALFSGWGRCLVTSVVRSKQEAVL